MVAAVTLMLVADTSLWGWLQLDGLVGGVKVEELRLVLCDLEYEDTESEPERTEVASLDFLDSKWGMSTFLRDLEV